LVREVRIAGNGEERGGREYKLALGRRRADAVLTRLTLLGEGSKRVKTVRFGEEKPSNAGHDAVAGPENRRADIAYK
jgi:peptidoglycan-associated lipoprotein